MVLENWEMLDSLYMTVITITTVGFREVKEVSPAGRVFTLILIFMGMGIMAFAVGMVAQLMVDLQVRSLLGRRKLGLKKRFIKNHYIVCGYGRIGKIICQELRSHGIPLLIIDYELDAGQELESEGIPFIIDDATSEDALMEAGIERARGLITVVSSDADNLFITMTARGLNPLLFILARGEEEHTEKKLLRAGANRVVLPYMIGGRKMAQIIVKPTVTDFLELTVHDKNIELEMEEFVVGEGSRLNGVTLAESGIRQEMNIIVVAIRRRDGVMTFNPSSQTRIESGDTLIALGYGSDFNKLTTVLSDS
jgi:voltage-gated potassium channel